MNVTWFVEGGSECVIFKLVILFGWLMNFVYIYRMLCRCLIMIGL